MKKVFCDFCRVEFSEERRKIWVRWHKIMFSAVGTGPMNNHGFDACEECAEKIQDLIELYQKLRENLMKFDDSGKKPVHSAGTMKWLRGRLNPFHLHVNERSTRHIRSHRSGKELFLKCPDCEGEVELGLVGKAGSKLYFGCPVCGRMIEFVQYDKTLRIGETRIIS